MPKRSTNSVVDTNLLEWKNPRARPPQVDRMVMRITVVCFVLLVIVIGLLIANHEGLIYFDFLHRHDGVNATSQVPDAPR